MPGHVDNEGGLRRRPRRISAKEFDSAALHVRFERHVRDAQGAFLSGDSAAAEREATMALRIRPTPPLFALLAVIAESKGQFDRASDFRLLQAFLSHDAELWRELLHEFLSQQLYYKSAVCLQRMVVMEKDATSKRALQLQLADLFVGLGEISRAASVLVPLWNGSGCQDFEVFALLSALYFQLGKWSALQRLIVSSLKISFHVALPGDTLSGTTRPGVDGGRQEDKDDDASGPKRAPKRVRFLEVEDAAARASGAGAREAGAGPVQPSQDPASVNATAPTTGANDDEFNFDSVAISGERDGKGTAPPTEGAVAAEAAATVRNLYSEKIDLSTRERKRNFLTLANVLAELLNEGGQFSETVRLMEFAAASLQASMVDLPPDLLTRLATAYAHLRGQMEKPCQDVVKHLLDTCSMEEYGDALFDAASAIQKVGMHGEALGMFTVFENYYTHQLEESARALEEMEAAVRGAEEGTHTHTHTSTQPSAREPATSSSPDVEDSVERQRKLQMLHQKLVEMRAEHAETVTVLAAACYGAAVSLYALEQVDEAARKAARAVDVDPTHLQARLLLGKIHFYRLHDEHRAVEVLTPREREPALYRIQLGASLVRVFYAAGKFVEAIALGVSIFEMILASVDDGDAHSVAPGSSRRSAAPLLLPAMSRASSAILPATSLAAMAKGPLASLAATSAGGRPGEVLRRSASLAASMRSGTSLFRQQLTRRGRTALTTTVYGASAAASLAAGWGREDEEAKLKDSSTIFCFNRRRKRGSRNITKDGDAAVGNEEEQQQQRQQRARERRHEATARDASDFWRVPAAKVDPEAPAAADEEVRTTPLGRGDGAALKRERADEDGNSEQTERPPGEQVSAATVTMDDKEARPARERERQWASGTAAGEKDRDLAELEAFAQEMEAVKAETHDGDDEDSDDALSPDSLELPSLEDISKGFKDPSMAKLFLQASAHDGSSATAADDVSQSNLYETAGAGAGAEAADVAADRATLREAMTALGCAEFMQLTVTVVDAYSALGKFAEAKEFAFVALSRVRAQHFFRQLGSALERPLRLALLRAAMAAGHSEDAFRVGLRLLQEGQKESERNEVIELMHGVLNRCKDRTAILYRVFTDGECDVPLLVLLANRYHQARSYSRALNVYLRALQERPSDIFLNFMVGLSYLFCSHQKNVRPREAAVSAAVYYLSQYQTLVAAADPHRTGEALYNSARALQFLRLHFLCVPLYERIAHHLTVPEQCTQAVQRAACVNLYFIHTWESANCQLALSALPLAGTNAAVP